MGWIGNHICTCNLPAAIMKAFGKGRLMFKETKISFPKEYFSNMSWFHSITSKAFTKHKLAPDQILLYDVTHGCFIKYRYKCYRTPLCLQPAHLRSQASSESNPFILDSKSETFLRTNGQRSLSYLICSYCGDIWKYHPIYSLVLSYDFIIALKDDDYNVLSYRIMPFSWLELVHPLVLSWIST